MLLLASPNSDVIRLCDPRMQTQAHATVAMAHLFTYFHLLVLHLFTYLHLYLIYLFTYAFIYLFIYLFTYLFNLLYLF
jgi:hypothetical protein